MQIEINKSLRKYNTFGVDVKARYFVEIVSLQQLKAIQIEEYPYWVVIGRGSNLLFTKDYEGLVIYINLKNKEILDKTENTVRLRIGAGELWHDFVSWSVANNYGGVENMALIPGSVGASPIQNIGAYGVELKDVFLSCEVYDIQNKKTLTIEKKDAHFDYRNSIFKQHLDKWIVLSVDFGLTTKNHNIRVDYGNIKNVLVERKIQNPTIKDVYDAVIMIRKSKLPNPDKFGNAGSFFKNPVISKLQKEELHKKYKQMPSFQISEHTYKIPAGWLIEQAGFKNVNNDKVGVYQHQALIIINKGNATGKEILLFSQEIHKQVQEIFDIDIEKEVRTL